MSNKRLAKLILGGLGVVGLISLLKKKPLFLGVLLDDCDGFSLDWDWPYFWRWFPPVAAASEPQLSTNRVQGDYSIAMGKDKTNHRGSYYYYQNEGQSFSLRGKELHVWFYINNLEDLNLEEDWAIRFCFG